MSEWFRVLAVSTENPAPVPSTILVGHNYLLLQFQVLAPQLLLAWGIYVGKMLMHIK